ncbi:MAG: DUF1573 domain-containing protein [Phycisphaerae bacterium]
MKTLFRFAAVAAGLSLAGLSFAQENKPAPTPTPTPGAVSPAPIPPQPPQPAPVPGMAPTPTPNPDPNAPQPKLEISETVWNFGEVWAGAELDKEIQLKNVGQAPLNLAVRTSCGCTQAKKPKDVLQPGESDTMKISYNSKKRPGKANQTVTINTNDPSQSVVTLRVEGDVKNVFSAEPGPAIAFGRLGKDSTETQKITLKNEYPDKMTLKLKQPVSGPFEVELKELEPGMRYELSATSKPPLPMGLARAEVILETGIAILPEIDVHVQGYVQPPVMVNPTVLYVPTTATQNMERMVRVTYLPDKPIQIQEIKCNLASVTWRQTPAATQPAGAAAMAFHDVRVTLPPAAQIPENGALLEIATDSPDPEYKLLKVQITTQKPIQGMPPPVIAQPAPNVPKPPVPPATGEKGESAPPPTKP